MPGSAPHWTEIPDEAVPDGRDRACVSQEIKSDIVVTLWASHRHGRLYRCVYNRDNPGPHGTGRWYRWTVPARLRREVKERERARRL